MIRRIAKIFLLMVLAGMGIERSEAAVTYSGTQQLPISSTFAKYLSFSQDGLGIAMQNASPFDPFSGIPALAGKVLISNITVRVGATLSPSAIFFYVDDSAYADETSGRSLALSVTVTGNATVLGVAIQAQFAMSLEQDGTFSVHVKGVLPSTWKVSDCMPVLKGTLADQLQFSNLELIIASSPYRETDLQMIVPQGIGFGGQLQFAGPLANMQKVVPLSNPYIVVYGALGVAATDFSIRATLGVSLSFPGAVASKLTSAAVTLEIAGSTTGVSCGLAASITVTPTPQDTPLVFISMLSFGINSATVSGTMQGSWQNPFGISGFSISNCALSFTMTYEGVLSGFGITGSTTIGTVKIGVGLQVTDLVDPSYIYGQVQNLNLSDIMSLMGISGVPSVELNNVKLYVVPGIHPIIIGGLTFQAGISLVCDVSVTTGGTTHVYNNMCTIKILPPVFVLSMQSQSLSDLTTAVSSQAQSTASASACARSPRLLASLTSDIKSATSTVTSAVSSAASTVTSAASSAASTVVSATQKLVNELSTISVQNFTININPTKQSIDVQIGYAGKTYSYSYSISLLSNVSGLISAMASSITGDVKKVLNMV